MTWKTKKDGVGNALVPGDVCIRSVRGGGLEYLVFVDTVWGGQNSSGEYGRFLNNNGLTSIKYRNILLAFDPVTDRRAKVGIKELTRMFYERGK